MSQDLMVLIAFNSLYILWVLVPVLPAVVIYKLFPQTTTQTEWKILGFVLKAGGASGFYFAILALMFFKFMEPITDYIKSWEQPFWVVTAPIKFVDAEKKEIVASSTQENLRVQPFSHELIKTGERRYQVTLRFSLAKGDVPNNITLIFPEGEGFIELKKLKEHNSNKLYKTIDLTNENPFEIRPVVAGGQNQPTNVGFSSLNERSLETNERRR